jgi:hypothetical protein
MAHKPPGNSAELLRQARRLMESDSYRRSSHPDFHATHSVVERIYRLVYGEGPVDRGHLGPDFRDGDAA